MIEFEKKGVYVITNTITNDKYVGSTTQSFKKRKCQHFYELYKNKHKNAYLQNSYNKYGAEAFIFEIIEISEPEIIFDREQYYIDTINPKFNINRIASGTPNMSKETIIKRSITFNKLNNKCLEFYKLVKENVIQFEEVDECCKKIVKSRLDMIGKTWNKGLTKETHDYAYLKVPKKNLQNWEERVQKTIKTILAKQKPFFVSDYLGNKIGYFENIQSFIDYSDNNFILYFTGSEKTKGFKSFHIQRCLQNKIKHYKGVIFSYNECVEPLNVEDFNKRKFKSFEQIILLLSKEI
jgi:group I intron endonuclease